MGLQCKAEGESLERVCPFSLAKGFPPKPRGSGQATAQGLGVSVKSTAQCLEKCVQKKLLGKRQMLKWMKGLDEKMNENSMNN